MPQSKRLFAVHTNSTKRRRVTALTGDERRRVVFLFDALQSDPDQVVERAGIIGLQRGDVLAIVLGEMRKPMGTAAPLELVTRRAG